MKRILILLTICVWSFSAFSQVNFDDYFLDKTMRVDYFHIGDAKTEIVTIDQVYQYGTWAGSLTHLIDPFDNGQYYLKIYDAASNKLIFSKGFDSYFFEYTTSSDAANGIKRTYHETALLPYPKSSIRFVLEKRDKFNKLNEVFSSEIDPDDVMIIRDRISDAEVTIVKSQVNGDPHVKLDIAFIGEGYTKEETDKFNADLQRFKEVLFGREPYKSNREQFNIYGVLKPSEDSGVDEPRHDSFKNTALNATFNSLGSERYLLTEDNKSLRNIAAHVPYDALYIMVNHYRYGGGGIYNLYCTFTVDNQWSEYLFVHEFGHSLLGLADEYYTSDVAYSDFYPSGVEPNAPNVTALLDPENIKWKDFLSDGIELPTPWEKAAYDSMDLIWQKKRRELNDKIAELKRNKAPELEVKSAETLYNRMDREHTEKMHQYLQNSKFSGKVGAFEGAGYATKGLYRPMIDCIMFSKGTASFCKVCEAAIERIINYYSR